MQLPDAGPSSGTQEEKAKTALVLARAVRSTTHAHQTFLRKQLDEGEVVLDILRAKVDEAAARLQEADRQLGNARKYLEDAGIPYQEGDDLYMEEVNAPEHAFSGIGAYRIEDEGSDDWEGGEDTEAGLDSGAEGDSEIGNGSQADNDLKGENNLRNENDSDDSDIDSPA